MDYQATRYRVWQIAEKNVRLTYLMNFTGSFAGPFDRPIHIPVCLGKSKLDFGEYTNFTHEPKEKHYKYMVDKALWNNATSSNALETLVPLSETDETGSIAGPCQETKKSSKVSFSKIYYTCEDGKCLIPCLCAMCNMEDDINEIQCNQHIDINFVASGFDPETDMMTVCRFLSSCQN